jgi:nucleotide-binding universal stress UspA family protein
MFKKVLVALDGSEPSENALCYAIDVSLKYGAELRMLAVVPRVTIPVFPDEGFGAAPITAAKDMVQYQERMKTVYQNVLSEALERVKIAHPELKTSAILREGRPSSTIVEEAESDNADLIIIGSRGIGGITGWILGSTSRRVVDSCTKPILVIK